MKDICSLEASGLLTVNEALANIKNTVNAVKETEKVCLQNALGRVLASPVRAPIDLPFDRNSAMDGYAFSSSDIQSGKSFSLNLAGTSWAGRPFTGQMKHGECVRIFTGAVLPAQADSVIMQEQVSVLEDVVTFPAHCQAFQNVRSAGEDVKQHDVLLAAQKKLSAADLGLLAAAGIAEVAVFRKIKVAFFSTGDELVPIGQTLKSGQIYDSNRYILHGLLTEPCLEITDMGIIADDKMLLEHTLLNMAKNVDMLITTGGASVGDADYIRKVLLSCGKVNFWKIAMKPGKPLLFGSIQDCLFFGLPGNPVAVIATFDKLLKPALQKITGKQESNPWQIKAICQSKLKKLVGRQEYQRGILSQDKAGVFTVKSTGSQGSNILNTISKANCYIVLPDICNGVEIGEEVIVEPFEGFI